MYDAIPPYTRDPLEIIDHAEEHYHKNTDIDRKIALIGFDNAIEVSIEVFIHLHPKLRGGLEIKKDDVDKATHDYYSKIDFLEKYITGNQIKFPITINNILFYHGIRNNLYHSGSGMVPRSDDLKGIRAAAIAVYQTLFKIDISKRFNEKYRDIIEQAVRPFATSDLIRYTLKKDGPYKVWRRIDPGKGDTYYLIVKLPGIEFGVSILKLIGNNVYEISSYKLNRLSEEGFQKHFGGIGAIEYEGELPFSIK